MSATNATQKSSTESIPASAGLVGVDGNGDRHYVGNPVTDGTICIYVKSDDGVATHDLAETPCIEQPDAVEAWIQHVARHRGEWEYIAYERPVAQRLAEQGAI